MPVKKYVRSRGIMGTVRHVCSVRVRVRIYLSVRMCGRRQIK